MILSRLFRFGASLRPSSAPIVRLASNSSHPSEQPTAPDNTKLHPSRIELTKCLVNQGIPAGTCEEILALLPTVRFEEVEVHRTLNALVALQFGQERLINLLKTHPGLIFTSATQIGKCYSDLVSIFTQNYVYKVLMNSPNVVEQKRSELADKINYLNKMLGIPNTYIVNSSALSYPLFHLKLRSEFLKRCGILKTPTKRDEVMTVIDLNDMFHTSDTLFATKVAKLTIIEFEAFKILFSMEMDSDSEWESDSDSN